MSDVLPEPSLGIEPVAPPAVVSRRYGRYALGLLLVVNIFNFMDRQFLNILSEPIKRALHLADWQIGFCSGLAFVVLYATAGIPIALMADRVSRPLVVSVSLIVWSAFTALSGAAHSFFQLALFRAGVGAGEAGSSPAALSLIADFTPKQKRATALGLYSMGPPLGGLIAKIAGGAINDAFGWRIAFVMAGLPGIGLAILAATTLRETRAKLAGAVVGLRKTQAGWAEAFGVLLRKPTFWLVALGAGIQNFVAYGYGPFLAPFYLRNHGHEVAALAAHMHMKSLGFLGLAIGLINGIFGATSSLAGGWIADRVGRRDVRLPLLAPSLAILVSIPGYVLAFTVSGTPLSLALLILPHIVNAFWFGPTYAIGQSVVPANVRATASAVLLFITTMLGAGIGPVSIGILSDWFNKGLHMGEAEGLRWAMVAGAFVALGSAFPFWAANRTISADTES